MELGSNSPIIVMPDADLEKVAEAGRGDRLLECGDRSASRRSG